MAGHVPSTSRGWACAAVCRAQQAVPCSLSATGGTRSVAMGAPPTKKRPRVNATHVHISSGIASVPTIGGVRYSSPSVAPQGSTTSRRPRTARRACVPCSSVTSSSAVRDAGRQWNSTCARSAGPATLAHPREASRHASQGVSAQYSHVADSRRYDGASLLLPRSRSTTPWRQK
eukprot:4011269-Pleurochrysis_carterae.AAC.2